jgi:hypothetical protein
LERELAIRAFLLLAAVFTAAPLALPALRCSPALWPLGVAALRPRLRAALDYWRFNLNRFDYVG